MAKLIKHKWIVFLLLLVVFVTFDTLVYNTDISKRAIVVGIGIDIAGENVEVSVQVVLPKNGGTGAGENNYIIYSEEGSDMPDAIGKISSKCGKIVSLAQTTSVIIGYDVLVKGKYDYIKYLLRDDKISDTTIVVMAQDKAKEILEAKVPVGEVASFQIGNICNPTKKTLGTIGVNIKQFIEKYHTGNGENYLPIVKSVKTPPSTDQDNGNSEQADMLVFAGTSVLDNKGIFGMLEDKETEGLSLYNNALRDGTIVINGRDNTQTSIHILASNPSISYDYNNRLVKVKLKMKTLRSDGIFDEGGFKYDMDNVEIENFKFEIKDRINKVFEYSKKINSDILKISEGFYRKYPKNVNEIFSKNFLQYVKIEYDISIIQR